MFLFRISDGLTLQDKQYIRSVEIFLIYNNCSYWTSLSEQYRYVLKIPVVVFTFVKGFQEIFLSFEVEGPGPWISSPPPWISSLIFHAIRSQPAKLSTFFSRRIFVTSCLHPFRVGGNKKGTPPPHPPPPPGNTLSF
jgi:hypothetical protein